jgi:hypothetical protein
MFKYGALIFNEIFVVLEFKKKSPWNPCSRFVTFTRANCVLKNLNILGVLCNKEKQMFKRSSSLNMNQCEKSWPLSLQENLRQSKENSIWKEPCVMEFPIICWIFKEQLFLHAYLIPSNASHLPCKEALDCCSNFSLEQFSSLKFN